MAQSLRQVPRREWLLALLTAGGLALLLLLPYVLGYGLTREGLAYTGLIMNPEDSQSYFAKMLQGYDGRWLYTIPFTPEEHEAAFLGGFYLGLGHAARGLGLSLETIWHLARVLAAFFLFSVAFVFVAVFVQVRRVRWTAYLLAVSGSGLGWLLFALGLTDWLGAFPVDFKMPEAHLFFTALTFPHVAVGSALLMIAFMLLVHLAYETGLKARWIALAAFVNFSIGIVYPFLIYLVAAVAAVYWVYLSVVTRRPRWRTAAAYALPFLLPAPLFVYYAYTLRSNPVFRAWDKQAATLSPPWPHYLIAFGLMLGLALLSIRCRKGQSPKERALRDFLWLWIIVAAIMVYAPLNPQRRFVQGVQTPLAILAAVGFIQVLLPALENTGPIRWLLALPRYSAAGLQRLFLFFFLFFMAISNLYLLVDVSLSTAFRQPYPFFRDQEEIDVMTWLRENGRRTETVLATYETGNYLAARVGNPVVIGHWAETKDWAEKSAQVSQFYRSATSDDWRCELLARYQVAYVWYGAQERILGEFSPQASAYLQPAFGSGDETLYRVAASGCP